MESTPMDSMKVNLIFSSKISMSISIKLLEEGFFPEPSLPTYNLEPWTPSGQENMLAYSDLKILFLDILEQETTGPKVIILTEPNILKPS